jgi:hypothetical protein
VFDNGTVEEFSEDCSQPIQDLSLDSPRLEHDCLFSYNLQDINDLSTYLGIIWKLEKDQPFAQCTIYIGFLWDLNLYTVLLSMPKVEQYLLAIHTWRKKPMHALQETLQLYGKLMHTCTAITRGRVYLTSLEHTIAVCQGNPYMLL